jgi:hypothetical protein
MDKSHLRSRNWQKTNAWSTWRRRRYDRWLSYQLNVLQWLLWWHS